MAMLFEVEIQKKAFDETALAGAEIRVQVINASEGPMEILDIMMQFQRMEQNRALTR